MTNEITGQETNMKSINEITEAINATIAARQEQLPTINAERARIEAQIVKLGNLHNQIDELLAAEKSEEFQQEVLSAKEELDSFTKKLTDYVSALDELRDEFTRETLNIGVSGAARTGKSTTLQHITGLTDQQIPSGGLNPVTAVRSEIYNSSRNEAVITFKTTHDFIEGYVRPHVENVNQCLAKTKQLSINSLADLKSIQLPEQLKGSVPVAASDSLKRLYEAQRSVATYEKFLNSTPMTVALDDVRDYVTYPSPDDEIKDTEGKAVADRKYLAVELAQVFCPFPNLGDAKVGLVDLPGLGEIGNSASEVHLKGLESKVDQIFLVMRPYAAKAFADEQIGCNLDQLRVVQPAVNRGDLIVAGINKDKAQGEEAAANLRAHFDAEINKSREDRYTIMDYCAVDDEDVSALFNALLDRLGSLLPEMDKQKISYCMGGLDLSAQISAAAEKLVRAMDRVLRAIPSSDRVMKDRVNAIERTVVYELTNYANDLLQAVTSDSDVFQAFVADARQIHDEVDQCVSRGLFRYDNNEWNELTISSKDFYNLYRDEDKRIRYEIIDAYCDLDRFYGVHVNAFKLRVLNTFLRACGMDEYFKSSEDLPVDERIATVASELGSTLHDEDLDKALSLLKSVKFDFRSNVFLQIEKHLAYLANPAETYKKGFDTVNKRQILGGDGSPEDKQSKLRTFISDDATAANDAILAALTGEEDRFNKYLAVSIDFFNNYLFGKDEDNFKQVVIRGLIREYKEWVLPDADDASKSPVGQIAKRIKESAQGLCGVKATPATCADDGLNRRPMRSYVSIVKENKGESSCKGSDFFRFGEIVEGVVTAVSKDRAVVKAKGVDCVLPRVEITGEEFVNDATDFLKVGETVIAKVYQLFPENGTVVLSIKRCQK